MTNDRFAYWLQGLFELSNPKELSAAQVSIIKEHLDLVLKSKSPSSIDGDFFASSGPRPLYGINQLKSTTFTQTPISC